VNQRALRVALLAGGRSSEHEVSLSSAEGIAAALVRAGHEVLWVRIERGGAWSFQGEPLSVTPGAGLLGADVAFPALHGPFGEDGSVQGVLETLDVAYVGAGVAASAVCMDKVLFKELMAAAGIPQVDYVGVREERWLRKPGEVLGEIAHLGLPVFVKPAHLGSSVGIARVASEEELREALAEAFTHDGLVIVEQMARGVEVECGVLGRVHAERERWSGAAGEERALASEPGEIVLAGEWYDQRAKYTEGGMRLELPARISAVARREVRELALEVFHYAGCEGLARVDFFVDGEAVLVNELNTMPGFTLTSVYPKLLAASGVSYPELVDRLCRLGIERHAAGAGHAAGEGLSGRG
jgi:D-alanine-D-alanine ligase